MLLVIYHSWSQFQVPGRTHPIPDTWYCTRSLNRYDYRYCTWYLECMSRVSNLDFGAVEYKYQVQVLYQAPGYGLWTERILYVAFWQLQDAGSGFKFSPTLNFILSYVELFKFNYSTSAYVIIRPREAFSDIYVSLFEFPIFPPSIAGDYSRHNIVHRAPQSPTNIGPISHDNKHGISSRLPFSCAYR